MEKDAFVETRSKTNSSVTLLVDLLIARNAVYYVMSNSRRTMERDNRDELA